jgi:3-hydroxymyristoyl/3-hydroxydecanoyl-(acyl carrier protein) dehydratase
MGYYFVDRILSIERGTAGKGSFRARGVKAVGRGDAYLRAGEGGEPELSPSFLAEAVGQLAAWVAMSETSFRQRPVAGLTAEVRVRGSARAGDQVMLSVEIESLDEDAVHYHGEALLGGVPIVALSHSLGPLLPLENFEDPREAEGTFRQLLRPDEGEFGTEPPPVRGEGPGSTGPPQRALDHPAIDAIIERDAHRLLALTCVSRSAPYLAGHFPRDPVLPATLLFDAQVAMACELAAAGSGDRIFQVSRLFDLKMRDFVRPGSRLISEVRLRDRGEAMVSAQLTGRLGDRVVSSGRLELIPAGAR